MYYCFEPPTYQVSVGSGLWNLWSRVSINRGKTVLRRIDGVTWAEFDSYPQNYDPASEYDFGARGFAGSAADFGWEGCSRLYLGGHRYFLNQALANELIAAGYETNLTPCEGVYRDTYSDTYEPAFGRVPIGDEIIISGKTSTFMQGNATYVTL